jgi:hypothetical protein
MLLYHKKTQSLAQISRWQRATDTEMPIPTHVRIRDLKVSLVSERLINGFGCADLAA